MAHARCDKIIKNPECNGRMSAGELEPCHTWCKGVTPQVCKSGAGYYIGAMDSEGPLCRMTGYFPTREAATAALEKAGLE